MGVRFVIGRAGSGKTYHCLHAIRQRLRDDAIDGPRLIFLVPEQASLQIERAILEPTATSCGGDLLSGAHRAEVLSFRRLAYRVLDFAGGATRLALTDASRAMVLRHLVARRAGYFQFYRRVARPGASPGRVGGFLEMLGQTIGEFIQEGVAPEELQAAGGRDEPQADSLAGDDPVHRAKLHDLRLIYRDYLDYLGKERLDPSQDLQIALECLPRCTWLDGAELWVDGFASLSGLETQTLVALAGRCTHVDITVLADPSNCTAAPSLGTSTAAAVRLFSRTTQTYHDLRDRFIEAGLHVDDPLVLVAEPPPRFSANDSLASLERSLFAPVASPCNGGGGSVRSVEIAELPSRRLEVDYAVSRVCRWVQEKGASYRYRDIAIVVRDLEPYHDLLSEALSARRIPFFIDRRRPIGHHPIVMLLQAGTAMAADSMSLESLRLALKTGLLPVSIEAADELENYLIAHGISGHDAWHGDDWSFRLGSWFAETGEEPAGQEAEALKRVNRTRRNLLECLDPLLAFAASAETHAGSAWSRKIVEWFDRLGVGRTLKRWADEAETDGELDQAEEHRQVWRDTVSFLDDLAFAFGDVALTTAELADVLEAGLSRLTLGLVPPTVDQVLVGSIERSRHPDIKAAVLMGMNEGVFPKQLTEDPILNDDDRAVLKESGVGLGPGSRERAGDEPLLLYVALTRAGEALVVTYAAADSTGKALRPSPYIDTLCTACPGLLPQAVGDPVRLREPWDILSPHDLTARLAMEFRTRPPPDSDDPSLRGMFNELYSAVRGRMREDRAALRAMTSLDERDDARISPVMIERLYRGPLRTSVSELETYAACPFQHFARYVLRLRERPEAPLEPVDVGRVHHAILEDFVRDLSVRGRDLGALDEGELLEALHESCARTATRLPDGGVLSDARNAYLLRRSASKLARVVRSQHRLAQLGTSRPRAAELPFGFDMPGSLPAVELSTPAGRRVFLRGFIDRVDLAEVNGELLGIVIDYKRTRDKRLSLCEVYHGLSLQLLGYLVALTDSGKSLADRAVKPIGALYVSLESQYDSVDHPDSQRPRDAGLGGAYPPRGLLLSEEFAALDGSGGDGWSQGYSMFRKKDGTIGNIDHGDAADAASFHALLSHTRTRLGELADGILEGHVTVSPYRLGTRSPCTWCEMRSVCRFEMGVSDVRFLESLKRSEVFQRLQPHGNHP